MTKLLTTEELADMCRVPISTIYKWSYCGEGPKALKLGRVLRYRETDVAAWLEEKAKAGTAS